MDTYEAITYSLYINTKDLSYKNEIYNIIPKFILVYVSIIEFHACNPMTTILKQRGKGCND